MPYKFHMEASPSVCLECGERIVFGRPDRKFCSCACKNRYHNRNKAPDKAQITRRILHTLDRNHDILEKLLTLGIDFMELPVLQQLGFKVQYVTSYQKSGAKNICSCFDIEYELTPSRIRRIHLISELKP